MDSADLRAILEEARSIAEDAAALVLTGYRSDIDVRRKGVVDLVTDYDLRSEELIRKRLELVFPGHAIVGEEGERTGSGELVWFVDPIDGTTNFAHGHPFFAVSIGLCQGAVPLVGVVSAPALGVAWSGAKGLGAQRNDRECKVSTRQTLLESLCATGFAYDIQTRADNNVAEHAAFLVRSRGVRRCGSAAIDLAMVADGTYDAYWEQGLSPWDMAAGELLVLEGGGTITDYDGSAADPRLGRVVASNTRVHAEALGVIRETREGKR